MFQFDIDHMLDELSTWLVVECFVVRFSIQIAFNSISNHPKILTTRPNDDDNDEDDRNEKESTIKMNQQQQ